MNDVVLTFTFTEVSGGFRLTLTAPSRKDQHFWGKEEGLAMVREALSLRLDRIKAAVMRCAREDAFVEFGDRLDEAFEALHVESLDLLGQLVGGNGEDAGELALALSRVLAPRPARTPPPIVQVIGPAKLWAPIELLAAEHVDRVRIRSEAELRKACMRFLGLSAVVRRVLARPAGAPPLGLTQDRTLADRPALPVTFFHDASLKAARIEFETLRKLSPRVDVQGPWPAEDLERTEVVRALVQHLHDPLTAIDGTHLKTPVQIQHFACHCDTRAENARDHSLRLAAPGTRGVDVSIAHLEREKTATATAAALAAGGRKPAETSLPLIFLNACSSSMIDYRAASSFPEVFLSAGSRGFIGAETDIPDEFAGRFAARFYDRLLSRERTGQALNGAKWDMIRDRHNPLGILYTMYADPDLQVTPSQEDGAA